VVSTTVTVGGNDQLKLYTNPGMVLSKQSFAGKIWKFLRGIFDTRFSVAIKNIYYITAANKGFL
jgi:hypothetical protein